MVCQFAAQHFWRVDLYKDAGRPAVHTILIQIPMSETSVAKFAAMTASSIGIDGPLERHPLHAVENRLDLNLDPLDLRQNARACGLEETWLQRGGDRVRLRKEFGGEPHGSMLYTNISSCQCRTPGYLIRGSGMRRIGHSRVAMGCQESRVQRGVKAEV